MLGGVLMADDSRNKPSNETGKEQETSRREFLKNSGYAAGGLVGGGLIVGLLNNSVFKSEETAAPSDGESDKRYDETRMFFTRLEDFRVLEQATERVFPEDENGPGAIALGVPYFIDKQLAGDWGSNKKDYMHGPMQEVEGIATYQTLMDRGQVFIEGLRKINSESEERHNEAFYDIEGEQQDAILQALEDGEIELEGVRSSTFFNLLLQMTNEGAYADPLYGGNKDMQGWKMREFPGVRAGFTDLIDSEDFQVLEPTSLKDYQP